MTDSQGKILSIT